VIDSDWPDFLEVMQFLRTESGADPLVVVALLTPTFDAIQAQLHGADLVVRKPVSSPWTRRVLATASNLLKRDAEPQGRPAQAAAAGKGAKEQNA
jgi:hypothetical protein